MLRRKFVPAWQKGFTLIELLVVIGIIGILVAVVLVAVNPSRQFASARDTQRRTDLYAVTNALYQFAAENNGNLPSSTDGLLVDISTTPTDIGTGGLNLAAVLLPTYLPAVPKDPDPNFTDANTGYSVFLDANNRVVATAASELRPGTAITVSR
jgi:prepilin-type N-terminal cleavage/methylation domain-containing protein